VTMAQARTDQRWGTVNSLAGYQAVPSPPSGTGIPQTAASASPELGPFPLATLGGPLRQRRKAKLALVANRVEHPARH
jgi:hypothetical protein